MAYKKVENPQNKGGRPTNESLRNKGGRPSVVTPEVVAKLEEAFNLGCSDLEACFVANISKDALYNYQTRNPEFKERKILLKQNPTYVARKAVIDGLKEDPGLALKYLERKKKDEFGLKQEMQITGDENKPLKWEIEIVDPKKE